MLTSYTVRNKIEYFLDRIANVDSYTLIKSYENNIISLVKQEENLTEKTKATNLVANKFEDKNKTTLAIMHNPFKFWKDSTIMGKRLVLETIFSETPYYQRGIGFINT